MSSNFLSSHFGRGLFFVTQVCLLGLAISLGIATYKIFKYHDYKFRFVEGLKGGIFLMFLLASTCAVTCTRATDRTYTALSASYLLTGSFALSPAVWYGTYASHGYGFGDTVARFLTGFAGAYFALSIVLAFAINKSRISLRVHDINQDHEMGHQTGRKLSE